MNLDDTRSMISRLTATASRLKGKKIINIEEKHEPEKKQIQETFDEADQQSQLQIYQLQIYQSKKAIVKFSNHAKKQQTQKMNGKITRDSHGPDLQRCSIGIIESQRRGGVKHVHLLAKSN